MSETATLADHFEARAHAIIALWRSTVDRVGDVPEAGRLSREEFEDHVPALLERLSDRLRGLPADPSAEGRCHGSERWKQGYDVGELVRELNHLRSALHEATFAQARDGLLNLIDLSRAVAAINDVIGEATAESVARFQEDGRAATAAALAEVESKQASIQDAWITAKVEQNKLRTVLKSLPVGVWVVDADGVVVALNREAERLQGFPAEETVGRVNVRRHAATYRVARPGGAEYGPGELPAARALRGEVIAREEATWLTPGGERTVLISATPLTDGDGTIGGAVAVVQDVTERKRLQAGLAESEAQFRAIAEQSPVLIWRSGVDGLRNYLNATWFEFTGRMPEQELGDGWSDGVHPDDRARRKAAYQAAFDARAPLKVEYRLRRRDGQHRWIADFGSPYADARGGFLGYLGSCVDITERIELEVSLSEQRELAEASSRHKTRIVSALSHDARTPLNAVVLASQLLEAVLPGPVDAEVQECLRTIRHSVRNVLDLMGDLLDLSKIDAGALPAELSRFPVDAVLAECVSSIETQAKLKGLEVSVDADGLAGVNLETDRSKLKQILSNLLSNALRYTDRGSIRIVGSHGEDTISLAVRDTGVGIAAADQARIFDEFTILEHPERRPGEGTGLGLAICRRLASLINGEIALESTPGVGSTFRLLLPGSTACAAPAPPAGVPAAGPDAASGAVLIAEDHLDSRQTLARVLRRMGYRVVEAGNGRDALAIAAREPLMAVLMDVNMPIMDGIDATLALRADPATASLPIFALTGDVTVVNQRRIGEAGVDGYLEKPVTWDQLRDALAPVADRARAAKAPA